MREKLEGEALKSYKTGKEPAGYRPLSPTGGSMRATGQDVSQKRMGTEESGACGDIEDQADTGMGRRKHEELENHCD